MDIEVEFAFEVMRAELSETVTPLGIVPPSMEMYLTELHPK